MATSASIILWGKGESGEEGRELDSVKVESTDYMMVSSESLKDKRFGNLGGKDYHITTAWQQFCVCTQQSAVGGGGGGEILKPHISIRNIFISSSKSSKT